MRKTAHWAALHTHNASYRYYISSGQLWWSRVTWTIGEVGGDRLEYLKSVVASYMGCSPAFLRLSKINHLDTLCNLAPKYCRYRHLNVVLVLYFSKICCNLASYNYNWARSKGSVFHMCFSFFSFFCKSVFYSLCKCKHSGLHCSSVNTSSFEHVQGDFRKSKPLDSFHVSSLCLFEYMLRRCQERSCPDILLPQSFSQKQQSVKQDFSSKCTPDNPTMSIFFI